jgi:two-component system, NarL family, sensor histidine kinase UhpB
LPIWGEDPIFGMQLPTRRLGRETSLAGQVVAANVVLVTLTLFGASLAAGLDISIEGQRWQFAVLALAVVLTLCVNLWMLKRRFDPLDNLIDRVERVDPSQPSTLVLREESVAEIDRLARSFKRLLQRIEAERTRAGKLVLRAQEEERRRLARDLHDEVNQALTAILLRLEALAQEEPGRAGELAELKRLVNQAMDELTGLARALRPTALDDHGVVPAIRAQLNVFSGNTGIETHFCPRGSISELSDDDEIALYRVVQESLTNAARHGSPVRVDVDLHAGPEGTTLSVSDDGRGFDPGLRGGDGLGIDGMAERARLLGGELEVRSRHGEGTTVELRLP